MFFFTFEDNNVDFILGSHFVKNIFSLKLTCNLFIGTNIHILVCFQPFISRAAVHKDDWKIACAGFQFYGSISIYRKTENNVITLFLGRTNLVCLCFYCILCIYQIKLCAKVLGSRCSSICQHSTEGIITIRHTHKNFSVVSGNDRRLTSGLGTASE